MIRAWGLYLSARHLASLTALYVVTVAAVLIAGDLVVEVTLNTNELPRFTPIWEAAPVLFALVAPALIAPRLPSWEWHRENRLHWGALIMACVVLLASSAVPWVAQTNLPADARWWDISCNVLLLGSAALVLTAALGKVAGPATGLGLYAAVIAVQQIAPALAAPLPVSGAHTNLQAHPLAAGILAVVAASVWSVTLGHSRWAESLERNG